MAAFNNLALTVKGIKALLEAQMGTPLTLSKIGMGSGTTASAANRTDLVKPELMMPISEKKINRGHLTVVAKMTNESLTEGFYWRETGLFFQDAEGNDVLFAYASVTDKYDYVPAHSDQRYLKHIRIANVVADSANINVIEDEGLLYVDVITFDEFRETVLNTQEEQAQRIKAAGEMAETAQSQAETAQAKANDAYDKAEIAEAVALGKNQAHVFPTTAAMRAWLSTASNKGLYNVGDNLYIVELNVPDWWIAEVLDAADPATGFYYKIAQLETQKVDLTNIEADIAAVTATAENALNAANSACKAVTQITATSLAELAQKVTSYPIGSVFRMRENNVLGLNSGWITFSAEYQNHYDSVYSCEITLTITISSDDYYAPIKILIIGNVKNGFSIAATKRLADMDEIDVVKKSVSDGKSLVASAITANGVTTAADATFQTMANNVNNIRSDGTATAQQILKGSTAWVGKNKVTGTLTDYGFEPKAAAITEWSNNLYLYVPDYNSNPQAAGRVQRSIYTPLINLGNATAAQVLSGKTFTSSAGLQVAGTMTDYTGVICEINDVRDAPSKNRLEVAVPPGYHGWSWAGNSYEYLTYAKLANAIGLTADKIVSGNTICGIAGNQVAYKIYSKKCMLSEGTWDGVTLSNSKWVTLADSTTKNSTWRYDHNLNLDTEKVFLVCGLIREPVYWIRQQRGADAYRYMPSFGISSLELLFSSGKKNITQYSWDIYDGQSSSAALSQAVLAVYENYIEFRFVYDKHAVPLSVKNTNIWFEFCIIYQ